MAIAEIGSPAALDKARLLDMYAPMVRIRTVEDTTSKKFGSRPWRRIPGAPRCWPWRRRPGAPRCCPTRHPTPSSRSTNAGIHLDEVFDLEPLAAGYAEDGVYECMFAAPPLTMTGGVGLPINPQASK
jgi:hypothetical protein